MCEEITSFCHLQQKEEKVEKVEKVEQVQHVEYVEKVEKIEKVEKQQKEETEQKEGQEEDGQEEGLGRGRGQYLAGGKEKQEKCDERGGTGKAWEIRKESERQKKK